MTAFSATVPTGTVQGHVAPGFEAVADTFVANFAERGEVGASLSVRVRGEPVVDLWGGSADPQAGRAWQEDTVCTVFSCTKAATAFCAHLLAERGALDRDAPAADLWPELAANGKDGLTLRMMLDHTAGLPALREKLKPDCLLDWDYMCEKLAAEAPFWEPGTRSSYHAVTFGYLVGEMVRRASGRSLGAYFAEEIAGPLGIDYWIGLPEAMEPRVAPILLYRPGKDEPRTPFMVEATKRGSVANLFVFNHGDWMAGGVNTRAGRAAEIGAAGGITNGRGLAGLFAAMTDEAAARPLGFSPETLAGFGQCSAASHADATLHVPVRFGPGFMLSMDNRKRVAGGDSVILGARAFGHVGAGGSLGFADPEAGLAFGYAMNRQGPGVFLNPRGQGLVDATYRALGYRTDAAGVWLR
ncbi:MAG: beta-lactamase family protein [Alphaproteobacteria bacterium]|nr:beta-lactamase family protein [Alphaproteobacteria bacterium]MCB9929027.1 beta-lactamase family protein [Alphaproteobacteria bacterium]